MAFFDENPLSSALVLSEKAPAAVGCDNMVTTSFFGFSGVDFVYHEVVVSERSGHVEVVVSVVDCGTGSQTEGVVATETSERKKTCCVRIMVLALKM